MKNYILEILTILLIGLLVWTIFVLILSIIDWKLLFFTEDWNYILRVWFCFSFFPLLWTYIVMKCIYG